ncbi:MAG TPA: sensor histidine kinase [Streptosporangiaceae bacterium]|nr:sensor histidine kinase [Streptosporangiaceae bacterium]
MGLVGTVLLGLLALAEAATRAVAEQQPTQAVLALSVLALSATLPLAFLRPAPAAVAVCAGAVLSLMLFQLLPAASVAALLIAAGRLGHLGPPWWTPWLAVALGLPFLVLGLTGPVLAVTSVPPGAETHTVTVLAAALVPMAACAGLALRARSEATEHTAAREAIEGSLLEHTARGERARISRELHDVVAHHISMIAVQAETARLTAPGLPPATAQRLRSIGDTARDALTEMRRLLGVLREDTGDTEADRQPQPGLAQLIELLDEARAASPAGTRLIVSGLPVTLDPGVELAAYRIVQEALTNSRRHAPGAAVDVELCYADDGLRLRVRDNGPGPSPGPVSGGHGLLGMRERAAAVGGQLSTSTAQGGGFLITARLPGKADPA